MKILKKLLSIISEIRKDNIFIYSAHASFYIIISIIPFIMLILSFSRYIIPITKTELSEIILPLLPRVLHPAAGAVIGELFSKPSASVISITAVSTLWTASRGVAAIERGIARVYKKNLHDSFLLTITYNILHTISFIFMTILAAFLSAVTSFLAAESGMVFLTSLLKWFFVPIILIALLTFVYTSLSGIWRPITYHLPGAVFTAIAWIIASVIFSFYINNFANYSYIYGSLSAIILMLLWIYVCTIILLLGAEVNMLLKKH